MNNKFNLNVNDKMSYNYSKLLLGIIDERIQSYKRKSFSNWVGDHNFDSTQIDKEISELQEKRDLLKNILISNKNLSLNINIERPQDEN